jgi:hypothetical protein
MKQVKWNFYPLTGRECFFAASITSSYLRKLSWMLQFIFFLEKVSEADANMATSFAPHDTAASKPCKGAKPNQDFFTCSYN